MRAQKLTGAKKTTDNVPTSWSSLTLYVVRSHITEKKRFKCNTSLQMKMCTICSLQVSNLIFFIIAPIMLYLLHPYAKERNLAIHLVWIMMIFVGQSLFCLHFSKQYYLLSINSHRNHFSVINYSKQHFVVAGLFSLYFHMTLSFVGQMLDELSILWALAVGYAIWFPRRHYPWFIKNRYNSL